MSAAAVSSCSEFSQNAWRPELCSNCQRPRTEHPSNTTVTVASSSSTHRLGRYHTSTSSNDAVQTSTAEADVTLLPASRRKGVGESKDVSGPIIRQNKESVSGTGQASEKVSNTAAETRTLDIGLSPAKSAGIPSKGILAQRKEGGGNKKSLKRGSRVAFVDTSPDIIGYDGGLDNNIFYEEQDQSPSSSEGTLSFTDEEKYFALLALENTLWNSDLKNLSQALTNTKPTEKVSHEFEDVNPDALFQTHRFQTLRDCDAVARSGTFPISKKSTNSKINVENIFPASSMHLSMDLNLSWHANVDDEKQSENNPSEFETVKDLVPEREEQKSSQSDDPSLISDGEGRIVMEPVIAPYKIVNIIRHSHNQHSYTVGDITECLYDVSDYPSSSTPQRRPRAGSSSDNSGGSSQGQPGSSDSSAGSSSQLKIRAKPRHSIELLKRVEGKSWSEEETEGELTDSTTAAGLQVLDLLNDMLASYGENESSTDDSEVSSRSKINCQKSDFAAHMASVAATLDLSKQNRAKRPAPRPPSSPPPEPGASPKRRSQMQPEPVFKMVTVGRSILPVPPGQEIPRSFAQTLPLPSFDDLPETGDSSEKGNDAGRSKKGITSFFRNILRRGRESSDSFESNNPDIQLLQRTEIKPETISLAPGIVDFSHDTQGNEKKILQTSPQTKFRVLPSGAEQELSDSQTPNRTTASESADVMTSQQPMSSPPVQPKSKGLSSPKQILKRTAAKFSPPAQHKVLPNAKDDNTATGAKSKSLSRKTSDEKEPAEISSGADPVRRRAKSPKRTPPPMPPSRVAENTRTNSLTRELEQRVSGLGSPSVLKPETPATRSETQTTVAKSETRKSMSVPPPSPPTGGKPIGTATSQSPPSSPVPEETNCQSQPSSPVSLTPPDTHIEDTFKVESTTRFVEKIELPTAMPGKKGFLGKLSVNRKSRAPAPPSVKRARSISDAEKRGKKINPSDISGPVLVTDITNTAVLENRRNTISLGDDPALAAAVSGSQVLEKGFDDLDLPILSPLGSLENLYEAIMPREGGSGSFPFYDPPSSPRVLCPNIPAEGYLEPVPSSVFSSATSTSSDTTVVEHSESLQAANLGSASCSIITNDDGQVEEETGRKESPILSMTLPNPKKKRPLETASHVGATVVLPQSQSSVLTQHISVLSQPSPMTSSMLGVLPLSSQPLSSSPFMTSSMTSSLLGHGHSQPLDSNGELLPLPPIPQMAPRSVSKETVSSESDTHSSSGGTLSRPRPAPRRRPKRPDTAGSDQYVSMNRPNAQVTLGEAKLRETFLRLTTMSFQTLQDVYVQCERLLGHDKLNLPSSSQLKWADFDIYGQALHASGRCVVYNSKFRANNCACQLMVLHSRPAAEMSLSSHPSLLRPVCVFADNVPFSFLTADFIKTSQLLQNSVYDSCLARCFIAVGIFDVAESLASHLTLLRETLIHDPDSYLRVLLMATLQLLSAMSHCLDRGFTVTETDLGDVFLIARHDLRGKVVAFLPHQRAPDVPQGEAMCGFLDRLLQDAAQDFYNAPEEENDNDGEVNLIATVEKLRALLEGRRIECLAQVRSVVEYLLWGPCKETDYALAVASSGGSTEAGVMEGECSSVEQDLYAWLERERAATVGRFARSAEGLGMGVSLEDFYRLKFLLKSSATSLAECVRQLS
ncbi:hypothetical protein C0Q70_03156 [Pomacea canaliculata]|uniref:Uncharacterized protein n=1 Tax=Pomacea canaliculata TaxID=400727 RepID=A0A2T7PRX9_POMCA|nr:hypothetical protein C0Q70_03156 [Pomacea canaliculata]